MPACRRMRPTIPSTAVVLGTECGEKTSADEGSRIATGSSRLRGFPTCNHLRPSIESELPIWHIGNNESLQLRADNWEVGRRNLSVATWQQYKVNERLHTGRRCGDFNIHTKSASMRQYPTFNDRSVCKFRYYRTFRSHLRYDNPGSPSRRNPAVALPTKSSPNEATDPTQDRRKTCRPDGMNASPWNRQSLLRSRPRRRSSAARVPIPPAFTPPTPHPHFRSPATTRKTRAEDQL